VSNLTPQSIVKKAGSSRLFLKQGKASRADVSRLVSRARGGNAKAREQLVETYSYLPLHFASKNEVATERLSEAIKVGMEALQLAINQYQLDDPEHFTVYVRRWIDRRIQIYLRGISKKVKVKTKRLSGYRQRVEFEAEKIKVTGDRVKLLLTAKQ
jgi:DNA-directed RNA polymerase specialized sigma subunit